MSDVNGSIGPHAVRLQEARINNIAVPVFPLEVFPDAVQKLIMDADERMHYGIEFTGCSLLFAAASAIGNSCVVEMNPDWQEGVTLWLVLVGHPGTGKGHALKRTLKSIERQDSQRYSLYLEDMQAYKKALTKFQREKKNNPGESSEEPQAPILKKTILSDTTPEKMARVHADNPRGICLHVDELAGWLQTFNRYNTSNAQKTFNSSWSRQAIVIDRVHSGSIRIEVPCIMVGGTIQPKILSELMAERRGDDGFTHRLLFSYPASKARAWNRDAIDQSMFTEWDQAMRRLLELPYENGESFVKTVLRFSPDAWALLHDWQNLLVQESNRERRSYIKGVSAKIEQYAIRFSLIIQMIRYAYREDSKDKVGIEAVGAAIKLAEYFRKSHQQIIEEIDSHSPLDDLAEDKLAVYDALPEEFKRSEGIPIAFSKGMKERTADRFIKDTRYFRKKSQGMYAKLL
ncbi:DUF3987 domain-containing protein [Chlorobium phaeobacteroides]|uniref:DUF3987 domain-containing protein n=1 Tax=Chlorobium phaeobacteroides (strain DSM 266 / SMG 266 / 2430) TaxID=290317 RepID=A1BGW8_CHLPD|nr:DUF3987 domain-containing protein [Chlorobium phaeobacteroides]ABL65645.1 conserved hypothetical protein [Chlorobium phaeobacteroides DSM 266]